MRPSYIYNGNPCTEICSYRYTAITKSLGIYLFVPIFTNCHGFRDDAIRMASCLNPWQFVKICTKCGWRPVYAWHVFNVHLALDPLEFKTTLFPSPCLSYWPLWDMFLILISDFWNIIQLSLRQVHHCLTEMSTVDYVMVWYRLAPSHHLK